MAITVNLRYTGVHGAARKFAEEMTASGTAFAAVDRQAVRHGPSRGAVISPSAKGPRSRSR